MSSRQSNIIIWWWRSHDVQYGAVISRLKFFKSPPPPHNTLYGTPFCRFKSCLSCASVTVVIYAIWRYIGQRYNGTRQYCTLRAMKWSREKYIPRIQPAVIRIHDIRYLHRVIPGNICAAFIDYLLYYSDHLINVAVRSVASTHLIYEYALKPGYKMPYTAHHACAYIYLSFCMFDTILIYPWSSCFTTPALEGSACNCETSSCWRIICQRTRPQLIKHDAVHESPELRGVVKSTIVTAELCRILVKL